MCYIDWTLMMRCLKNEQTPEEEAVFKAWLDADSRHKDYYERVCKEWDNDCPHQTDLPKVIAGFDALLRQQRRRRVVRRRWGWSAAALVVCMLGIALLLERERQPEEMAAPVALLQPGGSKALLLLADGTSVRLDKTTDADAVVMEEAEIDRNRGVVTLSGKQAGSPMAYNTIFIPRGGEYEAVLEDGTRVWLNAETELKIPVAFAQEERRVMLSGEAYFEVAHEAGRPFIVETDLGNVRVFGTGFNVRNYAADREVKTTLVEGSVGFMQKGDEAAQYTKIEPGYQIRCAGEEGSRPEIRKVRIVDEIAWKNHEFCFMRCSLEQIMQDVGRWYDADIVFMENALKYMRFTVTLHRYQDIGELLRYFEEAAGIRFHIQGKNITVSGK